MNLIIKKSSNKSEKEKDFAKQILCEGSKKNGK
jgi:hypothetical protein